MNEKYYLRKRYEDYKTRTIGDVMDYKTKGYPAYDPLDPSYKYDDCFEHLRPYKIGTITTLYELVREYEVRLELKLYEAHEKDKFKARGLLKLMRTCIPTGDTHDSLPIIVQFGICDVDYDYVKSIKGDYEKYKDLKIIIDNLYEAWL